MACDVVPDTAEALRFLEFLNIAVISKRPSIKKLHLYLPPVPELSPRIASCLEGFIVNELDVDIIGDSEILDFSRSYYVPKCILSSNSMTKLYLQGCNMSGISINEINLPSLHELSVSHVIVDQKTVDNLITSCTGVEKLSFTYCHGFRAIRISGFPNLHYLKIKRNRGLECFEIDTLNLESLSYSPHATGHCQLILSPSCQTLAHVKFSGVSVQNAIVMQHVNLWGTSIKTLTLSNCKIYDKLDLRSCQNLSELRLSRCDISNEWLDRNLSQLSSLEALEIAFCWLSKHLKITSSHLERLTIRCKRELEHVQINCPNLLDLIFCTKGHIISLSSETILAPARVSLQLLVNGTGDGTWDVNLIEFLKQLKQSKYLSIETAIIENVIIPRRLRQRYSAPLCEFEELKLFPQGSVSCLDVTRSLNALLWLCPRLKTLHIIDERLGPSPPRPSPRHETSLLKMLVKLNYKDPSELAYTSCGCYPSLPANCWRHSLRDFEIIEQKGYEDNDGSLRRFLELALTGT